MKYQYTFQFDEEVKFIILRKKRLKLTFLFAGLLFGVSLYSGYFAVDRVIAHSTQYTTCKMIGNYQTAQSDLALFIKDPKTFKQFGKLDKDNDGIACEFLKKNK